MQDLEVACFQKFESKAGKIAPGQGDAAAEDDGYHS
jgi:hypothetical protein